MKERIYQTNFEFSSAQIEGQTGFLGEQDSYKVGASEVVKTVPVAALGEQLPLSMQYLLQEPVNLEMEF